MIPLFTQHAFSADDVRKLFDGQLSHDAFCKRHGGFKAWYSKIAELPLHAASILDFNDDAIKIGCESDLDQEQRQLVLGTAATLMPWRKGPFSLFGIEIDAEWRSNLKWDRLSLNLPTLTDCTVLDVGCGNGYFAWRTIGAGAASVLGVDPSPLFFAQYLLMQKYAKCSRFHFLPIGFESLPASVKDFDLVLSMGVLYHRRNALGHLRQLNQRLTTNGYLILETLIIENMEEDTIVPDGRYAKMRNVWHLMTVDKICQLLDSAGFKDISCISKNKTSNEEQRRTSWMPFQSLDDFLQEGNSSMTVEGYPAPIRAIFMAQK